MIRAGTPIHDIDDKKFHLDKELPSCYLCLEDIDPSVYLSWILPQCSCHGSTSIVHPECFLKYMRHKRFRARCSICAQGFHFPHAMATSPHSVIRAIYTEYMRNFPWTLWALLFTNRHAFLVMMRVQIIMILRFIVFHVRHFLRIYLFILDVLIILQMSMWILQMCLKH